MYIYMLLDFETNDILHDDLSTISFLDGITNKLPGNQKQQKEIALK